MQVKSTSARVFHQYVVNVGRHEGNRTALYRKGEIDFFAVYVVPEDRWYIIPQAAMGKRTQVTLAQRVGGKLDRYGRFVDAWGLLMG